MAYESATSIANKQNFDTTYTNEFDNDQTAATIITPTSGKILAVKGVYIGCDNTTSGEIRVYFGTSNNSICTIYPADNSGYIPLYVVGARDEVIKITSTAGTGAKYFVLINYIEV